MDGLARYGDDIPEFDRFMEAIYRPLPATARINTLKTDRDRLLCRLEVAGVACRPFTWYPFGIMLQTEKPGNLVENLMGHIHLQEEISMVSAVVLDPRPGERVLDLCAAPGSKTTQIAMMMENRGLVVANDPANGRVASLRSNCERAGAINVAVTRYDGRRFPAQKFDRVLVDGPCTGQGMARKDPKVLDRWSLKRSLGLQRLQVALLKRGVEVAKAGGTVVYSTCTFAPEENEGVVSRVLDQVRGLSLQEVSVPNLEGSPGLSIWGASLFGDEMKRCARYYPHKNDTGGFFVAKLVKE
ncbi:RsmB/NOP family class I SAM-dependent RNA methyltransferase [Methanotrichaceae archaeon M04Ac]|uniref:RsmB/NOP family class I SAM-dependent RNA methyltransferase n=1 Tax=Candidatus Methanocrinis alkalitolerans TaxID=3033395 RepID=A0ABT5XF84_9EURY|nr:RsmB/NOP family class I SAM-dependent RNA methyltransferase [Candidatus Methanocrinis alkalitolerans]MCR3883975.1 RsmB/NOP family class I SAM-dependent RNA methyltransferase [Methanothrix sp.]MDF0593375.1 RsmB/NOP family class I SAM-dependent RNA methyltransferase [Candidatus Methanocrinis alkalitolerans]